MFDGAFFGISIVDLFMYFTLVAPFYKPFFLRGHQTIIVFF